ncbi:D-2-hydroxyacid dehydrogenase family protein [Devosia sp. Root635]|uniref:D-2-hydroxyacid dehydrogenase family protein n=1 Tax=Devosia sp. Root635 TaxID=1736575 RepID=UPI00070202D3|nr:D-2-hydroxyacid dehydrogenase family protein [Devosia sp. Root635]KRA55739.1 hydroxyacid dehydrogenase [Devosia sp. Root635]
MALRCAILDDYQNVALTMADWSKAGADITVFNAALGNQAQVIEALQDFDIVCLMRERTPFPRAVIEALPRLKLICTTGLRNAAIDVAAARERGVVVSGTQSASHPTAELVFAHLFEFNRRVGYENARMKAGVPWQTTLGQDLDGKTLGLIGLGRLGSRVATIARAFNMNVIAWSQNLTPEKCEGTGATYASKDELFAKSDYISVHLQLSERSRGLIGAADLARMKPTAFLVNTSRGPIIEEAALIAALRDGRIGGAGLDVFDVEPLPLDHPYRSLDRAQISPHLGYVTEGNYRLSYGQIVENIAGFIAGAPQRTIES